MNFPTMLCICLCFALTAEGKPLSVQVVSEEAILINAKTGAVLFQKNAKTPAYPASITKMATALYAIKACRNRLDEVVVVKQEAIAAISPQAKRQSNYRSPPYWLETDATHVGIKRGEEIKMRDLLYAMLIPSANDAANVVAQHLGGTIPKFMDKLNAYLKTIGCKDTHFCNPHGLHHPDHKTTAYDMALIAREALKEPVFREICKTVRYTCPETNLEGERTLVQTNHLLRSGRYYYPKAIGMKTGYTGAAGKTLVAAAEDNDRLLIAVVLGCEKMGDRYEDVIALFEAAFKEQKLRKTLLAPGKQSLTKAVSGGKEKLVTTLPDGLYCDFYPSEETPVKALVSWKLPALPIAKNTVVGTVRVVDTMGTVLQETPLYSAVDIHPTLVHKIKSLWQHKEVGKKFLFSLGVILVIVFLLIMRQKSKRRAGRQFR